MENTRVNRAETMSYRGQLEQFKIADEVKEKKKAPERIITRMTAENLSDDYIERINVYQPGYREDPILGTDLKPCEIVQLSSGKEYNTTTFFSCAVDKSPYTLVAIAKQDGKTLSGRVTVRENSQLKIKFYDKVATMDLYTKDGEKRLQSVVLTENGVDLDQGYHPLA